MREMGSIEAAGISGGRMWGRDRSFDRRAQLNHVWEVYRAAGSIIVSRADQTPQHTETRGKGRGGSSEVPPIFTIPGNKTTFIVFHQIVVDLKGQCLFSLLPRSIPHHFSDICLLSMNGTTHCLHTETENTSWPCPAYTAVGLLQLYQWPKQFECQGESFYQDWYIVTNF